VRIQYRVRQFWRTIFVKTDPLELDRAMGLLTPEQAGLFSQLQPGEKDHSLVMVRKLIEQGENHPDLLVAAMLHDIGKLQYRLHPLERTMIVLAEAIMPGKVRQWGNLPPGGWNQVHSWRKAFVVAEQHAEWGAQLAHQAGVSSLTETLIREHHNPPLYPAGTAETSLQHKLWVVDNES
jgi:putative nucleotidyltransferase with HDIG domain